jgi:hypothetical protein
VGFARLGSRIAIPQKSLMRMFGPAGNPRAENLIAVVAALKDECQLSLTVHVAPRRRQRPSLLITEQGLFFLERKNQRTFSN